MLFIEANTSAIEITSCWDIFIITNNVVLIDDTLENEIEWRAEVNHSSLIEL